MEIKSPLHELIKSFLDVLPLYKTKPIEARLHTL